MDSLDTKLNTELNNIRANYQYQLSKCTEVYNNKVNKYNTLSARFGNRYNGPSLYNITSDYHRIINDIENKYQKRVDACNRRYANQIRANQIRAYSNDYYDDGIVNTRVNTPNEKEINSIICEMFRIKLYYNQMKIRSDTTLDAQLNKLEKRLNELNPKAINIMNDYFTSGVMINI